MKAYVVVATEDWAGEIGRAMIVGVTTDEEKANAILSQISQDVDTLSQLSKTVEATQLPYSERKAAWHEGYERVKDHLSRYSTEVFSDEFDEMDNLHWANIDFSVVEREMD